MILLLESKKLKRTGFIPTFLVGGILAALLPALNMSLRSEIYTSITGSPLKILLDANWQMMTMLNVMLIVIGSSMIYHTEHSDNAINKMRTLPVKESSLFLRKFSVLIIMTAIIFTLEAMVIAFCAKYWFSIEPNLYLDIIINFGYMFLLVVPSIGFYLVISSIFSNMWVSLGIGIICIFMATIFPVTNFILSLFPFAMPFQTLSKASGNYTFWYCIAACIEIVIACITEFIYLKRRHH